MAAYIKLDGINGESRDKDHKNWSDLQQFGQALHQPGAGASGAARRRGDVVHDDLRCRKVMDKSSPKIAEAVCQGKVIPKIEIHLTSSNSGNGRVAYFTYELNDVLITSYSVSGSGQSDDVPVEEFSLNFEQIKVCYVEFDNGKKKGNVEYSWSVEEGKKAA